MFEKTCWADGDVIRWSRLVRQDPTPNGQLQRAITAFYDDKGPAPTIDEVLVGIGASFVWIPMFDRSAEFEAWLAEMDGAANARGLRFELFYDATLACCSDSGMWSIVANERRV